MMLHSKLKTQLNSARSTAEINPHVHTKLTSYEQLLLWLLYADVGASVILGLMFHGITDHSVDNYASHVTRCILNALDGSIAWPDAEEREQLYGYFSLYEKAVAVLDGTHCEIRVPTEDETEFYSGYKKEHSQNYLIAVNVLSLVVYFDGPYAGRLNDRSVYNDCPLSNPVNDFLSEGEKILADGGFIGGLPLIVPFTKADYKQAADENQLEGMMRFNQEFSLNRTLVEHCIHFIKDRARLLTHRWPKAKEKQGDYLKAAIYIYNWSRLIRINAAINRL